MALSLEEKKLAIKRYRGDFTLFGKNCLWILNKDGEKVLFLMNRAQRYVHEQVEAQRKKTGKVRALVLKGRQQGMSAYFGARFYWLTTLNLGKRAYIITHTQDTTDELFGKVKRYHENNPLAPASGSANAKQLLFPHLDGGYNVVTAGGREVGRGFHGNFLHCSEVPMWPNAQANIAAIGQIVPNAEGTEIVFESTAKGCGNWFHEQWQKAEAGESEYIAIFVPWYWQDEYRLPVPDGFELNEEETAYATAYGCDLGQMAWRRAKIQEFGSGFEWMFAQEYPATPAEAFVSATTDPLIKPTLVSAAVNSTFAERQGPLLIGCDPAEYGPDRTSIVFRHGRTVFRVEYHKGKGPMEVAGLLANYFMQYKPDAIFVDRIGIGSGIVDRLRELKVPVIGVNSAESPHDKTLFANKRAEMWWDMKAFLEDTPCRLPNDAELVADLSAPSYRFNSSGLRLLESKDAMRARGVRSPDGGDALALTFAEPVQAAASQSLAGRADTRRPASKAGY